MSDETGTVENGSEGEVAEAAAYEPTPFDTLAREMGWYPPDEYKGDPDKWRSAEEYIKHGVQNTKALKRDLKTVKDTADRLARTSASITAKALADQRAELEAIHERAVEDGDKDAARDAVKELRKLDSQELPTQADTKRLVDDFAGRNDWYGTHPAATDHAAYIAAKIAKTGGSVEEQLEAAEADVRKKFPHLFDDEPYEKTQRKAPAVHGNSSRTAVPPSREKGVSDLPREARQAGEDYVKMINQRLPNAKYTLADYAKTYWSEQAA